MLEEPASVLGRHSPLETSNTDCISNDDIEKGHGDSELEVIMEAEMEHRRSSEITSDWAHSSTTRQRKQTVYNSSSQRSQEF